MAFWGIEVKPGKPYTHSFDSARGRLRITQATLGTAKSTSSTNKIVVQCNVGDKSPILLCNLIPDKYETCRLELEFEETEAVIFSVLGQSSVHLSGYYLGGCSHNLDGDETDSYGEDIAGSDTSGEFGSYGDEEEDEYDSDFIDDGDIGMFPSSPRRKSGVVIEEIIDDEKPSNGNANRRRLKKKHQASDSDGADGSEGQMVARRNNSVVLESEDEDGFPVTFSSRSKNAGKGSEGKPKSKNDDKATDDKKRKIDDISEDGKSKSEQAPSEAGEETNEKSKKKNKKEMKDEKIVEANEDVKTGGANNEGKVKKKKKKSKKGKTTEAGVDASAETEKTEAESVKDVNGAANNDEMDQDPHVNGEPEKLPNESATKETTGKQKKKNKKKGAKDDMAMDAVASEVADVNQTVAEKGKESKKNSKDASAEGAKTTLNTRSYPNGLVVEELAMGKPDGKRATPGKKVSVHYIGKLKNGKIFDSTVGKRPFEFRLGIGQVIKGWDVGVNGMRVGDKRRLTVPPEYGYGSKKTGPIPANSWLLFDVELVNAR